MFNTKIFIAILDNLRMFPVVAMVIFFVTTLFPQDYLLKNTSITIYNNDLGVVKQVREYNLNKGFVRIEIQDVAQGIDATSVRFNFDGEVIEQNYQYDLVSLDKILYRYLNKNVRLFGENDILIEGELLSASGNGIVLKNKDGLVMLTNLSNYRVAVGSLPEGLITKPTLVCMANFRKGGKQDFEMVYQTKGMRWQADYVVVLDKNETKIDINSWVSINNFSGASFADAKLRLVAGDVNLVGRQDIHRFAKDIQMESVASSSFEEKSFFEYHIYDLQRTTTIANNETKQISLFEAGNVKFQKRFIYNNSKGSKVRVQLEFKNSKDNNLGLPFPKGKVRIYKEDSNNIEFIGEDMIDHTSTNDDIKLNVGNAFDIRIEDKNTDFKQITSKVSESTFEVKIRNEKKERITVYVERDLGYNWSIKNNNSKYDKVSATRIEFPIDVNAGEEKILNFTVVYSY